MEKKYPPTARGVGSRLSLSFYNEIVCSRNSVKCARTSTGSRYQTIFSMLFIAKNMINLVVFGSNKIQRQINTANPDVRNNNTTLSPFILCQKKTNELLYQYNFFWFGWRRCFRTKQFTVLIYYKGCILV